MTTQRMLLTVEEYADELAALVAPLAADERLPLVAASGRVLARPVASRVDVPVFTNSAMDGYAVRAADVAATPVRLRVVADVAAGSPEDPPLRPGECARIMTGAPLPGAADTVVPVEHTDGGTTTVEVRTPPARPGAHVRRAGEDLVAGDEVAPAGAALTPGLVGTLAAVGVTDVDVRRRPVVAVASTGDELVSGGGTLRRGQIHESNGVALAAALLRDGAEVVRAGSVADDPAALAARLDALAPGADLVVLTGGASVGAFDVVRDVLVARGGVFRHVRMQPGKPQGWGRWGATPVVSLPGNPVSALISYEVFVRPLLDRLLGWATPPALVGVAGRAWDSPPGRRQFVPVRLACDDAGRLVATPAHAGGSASHLVSSLALADGLAVVAEDVLRVEQGDRVGVRRWA